LRRLGDARCLLDSGDPERTNGAIYIAGFTIECLLKAMLLERRPNLSLPVDVSRLSVQDREAFDLLYRQHDLAAMLQFLPEVGAKLRAMESRGGGGAVRAFRDACAEWTVYIRYSPRHASRAEAVRFVESVQEVQTWQSEL
jgi:hypothetical protein